MDTITLTDGTDTFRLQARSGALCTDMALTVTGFAGDESNDEGATGDWMNIEMIPPQV